MFEFFDFFSQNPKLVLGVCLVILGFICFIVATFIESVSDNETAAILFDRLGGYFLLWATALCAVASVSHRGWLFSGIVSFFVSAVVFAVYVVFRPRKTRREDLGA